MSGFRDAVGVPRSAMLDMTALTDVVAVFENACFNISGLLTWLLFADMECSTVLALQTQVLSSVMRFPHV